MANQNAQSHERDRSVPSFGVTLNEKNDRVQN